MNKIEPKLLLNFNRPIGLAWTDKINNTFAQRAIQTQRVRVFPEILVPSASDDSSINLTSLANTIYLAAREKNMSLAPYGHLDPVKFVIATIYVALLIEELRRDLSVASKYEFGNKAYGDILLYAVATESMQTVLTNMAAYVTRLNMLIKRCNALYIPAIHLLEKWLPHRTCIYKDDEGERFQFYLYRIANYYELDVTASSTTIGQLLFKDLDFGARSIASRLTLIESLLNKYEGDDDFVNFAAECIKAGLSRVTLQPAVLDSTSGVMLPVLQEVFSIDDVCSLENAYFISPVTIPGAYLSSIHTWDIKENTSTGRFEVGRFNSTADKLPVNHPFTSIGRSTSSSVGNMQDPVVNRPIFTHAKVESEEGMHYVTKYIAAVGNSAAISTPGTTRLCNGFSTATGALAQHVVALTTHSSTMLCAPMCVYRSGGTGSVTVSPTYQFLQGCYIDRRNLSFYQEFVGFKGTPYVVAVDPTDPSVGSDLEVWHDYDYITSVNDINLNNFNAALLWNDFIMIGSGVANGSKSSGKKRK